MVAAEALEEFADELEQEGTKGLEANSKPGLSTFGASVRARVGSFSDSCPGVRSVVLVLLGRDLQLRGRA